MSDPLLRKFDCVRLYVSDLDSGLAFYRERLGHKVIWRTEHQVGLQMPDSESEIVLHTDPKEPEIDFLVDSADSAAERFQAAGGTIVIPSFDIQIGRCVVVRDPWGNEYVLLDMSRGPLRTDADGKVIDTNGAA